MQHHNLVRMVNNFTERERANKEEMEAVTLRLASNAEEMPAHNEMKMEHGRQAVNREDGRNAEHHQRLIREHCDEG